MTTVEAEDRRRRPTPWSRRIGTAALIITALAVGRVVQTAFPVDSTASAPFERPGGLGDEVTLRYAEVVAQDLTGSTVIEVSGQLMSTTGVWVVVPLRITAIGEPAALGYAALRDTEGRTFFSGGTRSSFLPGTGQAGVPRYATATFEIPAESAVGAELLLALHSWDLRRDDLAVVDLGIDAVDVKAWRATDEPILVPAPSDDPPADLTPGAGT